jgi:diacylglycerol O-acyltransferase / wax synthase
MPSARPNCRSVRLSPLDAAFLEVESHTAHMHVGWVALFRPPEGSSRPSFSVLRRRIEGRVPFAPRYRQKLAWVPFGLHDPEWIDDPAFDIRNHVRHSSAREIGRLVEHVYSTPLERDRPLWEVWITDRLADGRIGVVGKAHHCMVDGIAAVELASLFCDVTAEPPPADAIGAWEPAAEPRRRELLTRAVEDRVRDQLRLLELPKQVIRSPGRVFGLAGEAARAGRALFHTLSPSVPHETLNEPISPLRTLATVSRPLEDLRRVKRHFGTTVNDVVLAVAAGGVRSYLNGRGETPSRLKAMVPVSLRDGAASDLGNRISFVFVELPCDEPSPLRRLEEVRLSMTKRKEAGEPRGAEQALDAVSFVPHPVQHAMSHAVASARAYNLTVSNIPGPRQPLWMAGCPLEEAYPVVPLADRHAVSIGFTTVAEQGFFGIYADRKTVPDADALAGAVERSLEELLASAEDAVPALVT